MEVVVEVATDVVVVALEVVVEVVDTAFVDEVVDAGVGSPVQLMTAGPGGVYGSPPLSGLPDGP